MTPKQKVASLLRRLHLLQIAERARFLQVALAVRAENRVFKAAHPDYPLPPLWLAYDTMGHVNWRIYQDDGESLARFYASIINRYLGAVHQPLSVLEWGCGCARITRNLSAFVPTARISGTDYNKESIRWAARSFPSIGFTTNGLAPPLPFGPAAFDAVYSWSVFTHLSEEMHHEWLAELLRVTKPGGIVVFTTQGNRFRRKLTVAEKAIFDAGGIVVRGGVTEGSRIYSAFQSPGFVRDTLLGKNELLEHIDIPVCPQLSQDVWVVRKH